MKNEPPRQYVRPVKRTSGSTAKWIVPGMALVCLLAAMASLFLSLRQTVWCSFTDGISIKEDALSGRVRMVLFEEPYQTMAPFNVPAAPRQANFTPDEATLNFAGLTGGRTNEQGVKVGLNQDLYRSDWDGREWQDPVSLASINSPSNEIGTVLSPDGRRRYFVSDRAGGYGGYDIWVATWNGRNWSGITNAGPEVNSRYDEVDPAFAPGGRSFYFSSNRPLTADEAKARSSFISSVSTNAGYDIFSSEVILPERSNGMPRLRSAIRVDALNSPADDRHVSFTPRGDFVFFASSRDGGLGGSDVYWSRIVRGLPQRPTDLGSEINGETDDTAPSVRMEGFDILFGSGRAPSVQNGTMLWSSTAREVVSRMDYSRIDNLIAGIYSVRWWILLFLTAAVLLWYLIRHYRDLTNLFHKCLMGSAIVHVILVLLLATWKVASKIVETGEGAPQKSSEISINVNALAREKLATEIAEEIVKLPPSEITVVSKQAERYVPQADFNPPVSSPTKTIVARSTVEPVLLENAPSALREATSSASRERASAAPKLDELPPLEMPETVAVMETRTGAAEPAAGKPVESFVPVLNVPVVSRVKIEYTGTGLVGVASAPGVKGDEQLSKHIESVTGSAKSAEGAASGTPVLATGGTKVRLSGGGDASAGPSQLSGPGEIVSLMLASDGNDSMLRGMMPGQLSVPEGALNKVSPYMMRNGGKPTVEQVEGLGGSGKTEGAVGRALDWFARHQEVEGNWSIKKYGGEAGHDVGATGFALLCYLGWGIKHDQPGKYQAPAAKAVEWLVKQVKPNGDIRGPGGDMYDQGIAGIALAEAYALTRDPTLGACVSNVVGFIMRAQNAKTGGWRYKPGDAGDTSVLGWQTMALVSANMAGIAVPKENFDKAGKWLSAVSSGDKGGLYSYEGKKVTRGMTAEGMFCRQILGTPPDDPKMREGAGYLQLQPPGTDNKDFYYWYYGTLAMYQHGGQTWEDWNRNLKAVLPDLQITLGDDAGAWLPTGVTWGNRMGKVVSTAMATLTLEVYYRYLPFSFTKGVQPAQDAVQHLSKPPQPEEPESRR